jgi:quercetin dioxygenase-like cupin family protein
VELTPVTDTAKAPAAAFTGDVYVTPIKKAQPPSRLIASLVRFTPGARTNWHSHANGQTLHVTEGVGYVVNRDGQVIRMRAGDTVWTPPGEEHWHGGTNTTCMSHIVMLEGTDDGDGTTWLEPVTDEQYTTAHQD